MKHEWRKKEKGIYFPKAKPEVITLPAYKFITISGEGNPNSEAFSEYIGALCSIAYAIKITYKKLDTTPPNYIDWTVGVWEITDKGKQEFTGTINKGYLIFTLMIRQPGFVNDWFFKEMLDLTNNKKPTSLQDKVKFEYITEGKCVQMLHIGSYDNKTASFEVIEAFAKEQNLVPESKMHREFYLSDFRKVAEKKLKTVLRFNVQN